MIKLHIMLKMPHPGTNQYPEHKDPIESVEEEVKHALEMIDSGHDSHVEWKLINKLADELRNRKDKRSKNLMEMIEPIMSKYGQFGVSEKDK